MRSGAAQQGATVLPALGGIAAPAAVASAAASAPHAIHAYAQHAGSGPNGQAILPQAAVVVAPAPGAVASVARSSGRWPYVVVVIACIAIVASIVMLVQEDDPPSGRVKRVPLPSMDNNMNTDPMIPQQQGSVPPRTGPDPWGQPPGLDPNAPSAPAPTPSTPNPANPTPTPSGAPPSRDQFPRAMITAVCTRLKTCGGDDLALIDGLCSPSTLDMIDNSPGCENSYDADKATECLARIDSMISCGSTAGSLEPDKLLLILGGITECSQACS
jgi:hypothetical protein